MRRTWLLFWHTYWYNITRRGYLIFTFGLPVLMVAVPTAVIFLASLVIRSVLPATDPRPIGIIDPSHIFALPEAYPDVPVPMLAFPDEAAAEMALHAGEIQAYYYIQPDYWETGSVILTYEVAPSEEVRSLFRRWTAAQVREKVPPHLLYRYDAGAAIAHQSVISTETFSGENIGEWFVVFILIYFVRSAGLFTSGYMYDSIASESRHRTIEILLTSVSTLQFVLGKFFGLLAVGMTQLAIWGGGLLLFVVVGTAVFDINLIQLTLSWEHTGIVISMLLGAYILDQIIAAAAGMLRVSGGAGPQLFNAFSLATGLALVYAAYFVPRNPDTPLAVAASLFPFTSPIVLLIRIVASEVPWWQIAISQGVLWGTGVWGLWGLRALLRLNMVSYAARFNTRQWLKRQIQQRRNPVVP